jgi:hypothetical protein
LVGSDSIVLCGFIAIRTAHGARQISISVTDNELLNLIVITIPTLDTPVRGPIRLQREIQLTLTLLDRLLQDETHVLDRLQTLVHLMRNEPLHLKFLYGILSTLCDARELARSVGRHFRRFLIEGLLLCCRSSLESDEDVACRENDCIQ